MLHFINMERNKNLAYMSILIVSNNNEKHVIYALINQITCKLLVNINIVLLYSHLTVSESIS